MAWIELRPLRHPTVRHVTAPGDSDARGDGHGRGAHAVDQRQGGRRGFRCSTVDPDLPCFIEHTPGRSNYLRVQGGEPVFELLCAECGANYLRSMPDLCTQVRRSPISRVPIR